MTKLIHRNVGMGPRWIAKCGAKTTNDEPLRFSNSGASATCPGCRN